MCGIVGRFSKKDKTYDDIDETLLRGIRHRGPDGEGLYQKEHVFLGHRRLAIIDSEGGAQPVRSKDGRFIMVCNGEIFNYKSLKAEMKKLGEVFSTQSDMEVLLKGFQKYGSIFFDRLEGMYAGVIYDNQKKKAMCFRDPFGIKPFYYIQTSEHVFISSEVKALEELEVCSKNIDKASLSQLFQLGYVLGEQTLYKNVKQLLPGHFLHIHQGAATQIEPFTNLMNPHMLSELIEEENEEPFVSAFARACEADYSADVYLSGGMDSGLIACILSKELGRKPMAYSLGYNIQSSRDESDAAGKVAKELSLSHHKVTFSHENMLNLDAYSAAIDTPTMDPSAMALFELAREASKNSKVILSGEGGDEIFGGYHRYKSFPLAQKMSHMPRAFQNVLSYVGKRVGPESLKRKMNKWEDIQKLSEPSQYAALFASVNLDVLKEQLSKQPSGLVDQYYARLFHVASSLPKNLQLRWIDLVTFLSDALLPKADQAAMRHGIEVRLPFLQSDVLLYGFSKGKSQSWMSADQKPVLRKALQKYLPDHLIAKKKRGFEMPISEWFRGDLKKWAISELSQGPLIESVYVPKRLKERLLGEHFEKKADHSRAIYQLLMLNSWLKVRGLSLSEQDHGRVSQIKIKEELPFSMGLPSL